MSSVLVIGDCHAPVMRDDYVDFLVTVRKEYKCDFTILIGDVVDWHSINFHTKEPDAPGQLEEIRRAREQIAALQKAFPRAVVMTGNHDALPRRQAKESGLPDDIIVKPGLYWKTKGWRWQPRYSTYRKDRVLYRHGDMGKGGCLAALNNAKENFASMVQGHYHGQFGVEYFANEQMRVFGMQVGCGVDHTLATQRYGVKFNRKPILGCGVVIDGTYAYCEPMLL